jgi:hypothetical protein
MQLSGMPIDRRGKRLSKNIQTKICFKVYKSLKKKKSEQIFSENE